MHFFPHIGYDERKFLEFDDLLELGNSGMNEGLRIGARLDKI